MAYLQTVLQGLKALQIEETTKDIIKRVGDLAKHLKSYDNYHSKLGKNLSTVVNQYNLSSKEFKKIDKDVLRITGEASGVEPIQIEEGIIDDE
jgi:DNA recombination protein RmuC